MSEFTPIRLTYLGDAINVVQHLHPECTMSMHYACTGAADAHWQISTGDFESGDAVYTYMDGTLELIP